MGLSRLIATALLAISIAALVTSSTAYGQVLTIQPEPTSTLLQDEAIIKNLTISFENGTNAMLNDTTISQDRDDYLISIVNIVLSGAEEDELPTYSQVGLEDMSTRR